MYLSITSAHYEHEYAERTLELSNTRRSPRTQPRAHDSHVSAPHPRVHPPRPQGRVPRAVEYKLLKYK
eukprot:scaffold98478_cov31-Tisochrysis_lutea.AAC.4